MEITAVIAILVVSLAGYEFGLLAWQVFRGYGKRARGCVGLVVWSVLALFSSWATISIFPQLHDRLFVPIMVGIFVLCVLAGLVWGVAGTLKNKR